MSSSWKGGHPAALDVTVISTMQQATIQDAWKGGCPAALDVTVISTMQATIQGAASTQGHALMVKEARKLAACGDTYQAVGAVLETPGGMSAPAVDTLACLGRLLGQRLGIPPADSTRHLFQKCAISLWRGNAALWIRRIPSLAPSMDGVI